VELPASRGAFKARQRVRRELRQTSVWELTKAIVFWKGAGALVFTAFCKSDDSNPPIVSAFHSRDQSLFEQAIDRHANGPGSEVDFRSDCVHGQGVLMQKRLVHYGKHVRSFVELKSGLNSYRIGGPRPIDETKLNFQVAFFEVGTGDERDYIKLRAVRQEPEYGSGRLIDIREGPNVRLMGSWSKAS
jgi:hypothetical protein